MLLLALLGGCKADSEAEDGKVGWQQMFRMLQGTYLWRRGDYQEALLRFLLVTEESPAPARQYALAGLAASYVMQGEYDAALRRLSELDAGAPPELTFAALFQQGMIAYQRGRDDEAASFFREALCIDGTSVDAKINLELSRRRGAERALTGARQEIAPLGESDARLAAENALFSIIREGASRHWQNSQTNEAPTGPLDY
jgi:Ca-activated chloride channel family protein